MATNSSGRVLSTVQNESVQNKHTTSFHWSKKTGVSAMVRHQQRGVLVCETGLKHEDQTLKACSNRSPGQLYFENPHYSSSSGGVGEFKVAA